MSSGRVSWPPLRHRLFLEMVHFRLSTGVLVKVADHSDASIAA
jgi:hypothetical protein